MLVAIVAIGCATGLIKSWMNRNRGISEVDAESFNRLARAFMEHKKEMRKRVDHLEAIIADKEQEKPDSFFDTAEPESNERLTNDLQQNDRVKL